MLAQAAWFFPTGLATRWPGLRPALALYCGVFACDLSWPRLPEQLFIEASDLQMLDPARPNEVLLTATVRNRAAMVQDFPFLELTLTGRESDAARKVFHPADYRSAARIVRGASVRTRRSQSACTSIPASIQATGYRLYLFFA